MEMFTYFIIGFCAKDIYSWLKNKVAYNREIVFLKDLWIDDIDTEFEEEA